MTDGPFICKMPLCASSKGEPRAIMIGDYNLAAEDPGVRRFVIEDLLRMFEELRHKEHGDRYPLPSLDPDQWSLRREHEWWVLEPVA